MTRHKFPKMDVTINAVSMAHTSIKQLTEQIHFLVELLTEKQLEEYLLFLESKENYGNKEND